MEQSNDKQENSKGSFLQLSVWSKAIFCFAIVDNLSFKRTRRQAKARKLTENTSYQNKKVKGEEMFPLSTVPDIYINIMLCSYLYFLMWW